jgi:hypothetical protein
MPAVKKTLGQVLEEHVAVTEVGKLKDPETKCPIRKPDAIEKDGHVELGVHCPVGLDIIIKQAEEGQG